MILFLSIIAAALATEGDDPNPPRAVWVAQDGLELLAQPDPTSQVTMRLPRGRRLLVVDERDPGWLAVRPPAGAFSWIERSAIEEVGNDEARVTARAAAVRPGSDEASLPAGVWTILERGDRVRLVDRPPLVMRQADDERRVWYAIRPPAEEVRFVRSDAVSATPFDAAEERPKPSETDPAFDQDDLAAPLVSRISLPKFDPQLVEIEPVPGGSGLGAEFSSRLAAAAARHRRILAAPIESWSLQAIRKSYEALLNDARDPAEQEIARVRIAQVDRQVELARIVRELSDVLARTQSIDAEITALHDELRRLAPDSDAPFEATGLLQSSSTFVDNKTAYLLIDEAGKTAAYVVVQPGLNVEPFLARRVGVHGESRYNASLKARVVSARQVVPLDRLP